MALDPAARALLDLMDELGLPEVGTLSPVETRTAFQALRDPDIVLADVAKAVDKNIEGVPCRIYTPGGDGPFGLLIWYHGGGWVIGSMDETDPVAREMCHRSGCMVVNVDYRLAPEHRFPAGVDDAIAVARWVKEHASELGADPARIAVGGDSAGGNLAAIAAQQVPGLTYQVLVYPSVDMSMTHPSIDENAEGYLLTKHSMLWFRGHYLGDDHGLDYRDPKLSPLFAADDVIAGLPPALVLTAGYDPLRDEGQAYATRLEQAGVAVERVHFPDQIHAFFTLYTAIPAGEEAIDAAMAALAKALAV